jgi:replicative DNA helicase
LVALQVISKIIATASNSIVDDNSFTEEYFVGYENEFNFIQEHYRQYGNIPDKATFLSKFPEIELVDVAETDRYLVDTIREEYLYYKSVPVVQRIAELLKSDANAAAEYMLAEMKNLQPTYSMTATDIVHDGLERLNQFKERKEHQDDWFFTTGFEELDDLTHGIQRGEELFVLFARTNQGKSWILEKICTHVWGLGFNVGYVSPEMGANSIGYRFDTLYKNFSNIGLMWGKNDVNDEEYQSYIDELKERKNKFIVTTPKDFDNRITVTKLKNFIKQYQLDAVAVDGITYMSDERYRRGDNKTTSLTNISEDLMQLSVELGVPVLIVVQANRGEFDSAPELENIRDSDGIAHNASKVISIHQKEKGTLNIVIKKQRFGPVGGKLTYNWDINTGQFQFIPSYDDAQPKEVTEKKVTEVKKQYNDKTDVF